MILTFLRYLQAVGAWHTDAGRNIYGNTTLDAAAASYTGAFKATDETIWSAAASGVYRKSVYLDASIQIPTAEEFRTRTYATLGCVCVRRTQMQPSMA